MWFQFLLQSKPNSAGAENVIIVPGYGLAVAGISTQTRIPRWVCGRWRQCRLPGMPGHMNVLLAGPRFLRHRAGNGWEINGTGGDTDVAMVISAKRHR